MNRRYISLVLVLLLEQKVSAQASTEAVSGFSNTAVKDFGTSTQSSELYRFTGITAFGAETLVSIYDVRKQAGRWISVGSSFDGLTVQRYDPAHDTVTVQVDGKAYTLTLQQASIIKNAPPPLTLTYTTAIPTVGSPVVATTKEEKEAQDARLLVQDLLEISIQQRAAYEAARQKAATETKNNKP